MVAGLQRLIVGRSAYCLLLRLFYHAGRVVAREGLREAETAACVAVRRSNSSSSAASSGAALKKQIVVRGEDARSPYDLVPLVFPGLPVALIWDGICEHHVRLLSSFLFYGALRPRAGERV